MCILFTAKSPHPPPHHPHPPTPPTPPPPHPHTHTPHPTHPHTPMMTSSNGNIFRVTGPLCGEFTGPGEFPLQRPVRVTRTFYVFFDLRLNKQLNKQSRGWWFETLSHSLWRHCNAEMAKQIQGYSGWQLYFQYELSIFFNEPFFFLFCVNLYLYLNSVMQCWENMVQKRYKI